MNKKLLCAALLGGLSLAQAAQRFAWPRERRALDDILSIVGGGDAGLLEDVLRVS